LTTKISFVNLKGGVGKTTLAVNLAANLAYYHRKKVLLVDLDPQTNSTVSLVSPKEYIESFKKKGRTLKSLYDDQLNNSSCFVFDSVVCKDAASVEKLDLLVSDLELIDIDIKISHLPNNHAIVRNSLESSFSAYDFVFFDCPPNLGTLTQNGLFASDYYVVPVQPDFLSTFGIDLITGRVDWFKGRIGTSASQFRLDYGGIIFNRVRNTTEHIQKMEELRAKGNLRPFKSIITERTAISEASSRSLPVCMHKSGFGWKEVDQMFRNCSEELLSAFQEGDKK